MLSENKTKLCYNKHPEWCKISKFTSRGQKSYNLRLSLTIFLFPNEKIPWHYVVAIPCRDRETGAPMLHSAPSAVDFAYNWVFSLKQTTAPKLSQVNFHHRSHFLILQSVILNHAKIHNQFYVLLVDRSELSV